MKTRLEVRMVPTDIKTMVCTKCAVEIWMTDRDANILGWDIPGKLCWYCATYDNDNEVQTSA